jgi:hypothetical protein
LQLHRPSEGERQSDEEQASHHRHSEAHPPSRPLAGRAHRAVAARWHEETS